MTPGICQIVPTKDHPDLLRRLFESLRGQEHYLKQLIIVDGGTEVKVEDLCAEYDWLPITYTYVSPPGLARQRNLGLELIHDDIDLAGFWDDDLVLLPGCLQAMAEFWKQPPQGAGGSEYNIMEELNEPVTGGIRGFLNRFFLMGPPGKPGSILKSGTNLEPYPAQSTHQVEWISGGVNLYKKEVYDSYRFDEWYNGYGVGDDLDFSYDVSRKYDLYVVSEARLHHLPVKFAEKDSYLVSRVMATNMLHFVDKNRHEFSRLAASWCLLGWSVRHLIGGLRRFNKRDLRRSAGYFATIPIYWTGRLRPITRQLK